METTKKNFSYLSLLFLGSLILSTLLSSCGSQNKADEARIQQELDSKNTIKNSFESLQKHNKCSLYVKYDYDNTLSENLKKEDCPLLTFDKNSQFHSYDYDETKKKVVEFKLHEEKKSSEKLLELIQLPFKDDLYSFDGPDCEIIKGEGAKLKFSPGALNLKNDLKNDSFKDYNTAIQDLIKYRGDSLGKVTESFLDRDYPVAYRSAMAKVLAETIKANHLPTLKNFLNVLNAPEQESPDGLKTNLIDLLTELDKEEVLEFAAPQILLNKGDLTLASENAYGHFKTNAPHYLIKPLMSLGNNITTLNPNLEKAINLLEESYNKNGASHFLKLKHQDKEWQEGIIYNYPNQTIQCKMRIISSWASYKTAPLKDMNKVLGNLETARNEALGGICPQNLKDLDKIIKRLENK